MPEKRKKTSFEKLMERPTKKIVFDSEFKLKFKEHIDIWHEKYKHRSRVQYICDMKKVIKKYMNRNHFFVDANFIFELYEKGELK